MPSKANVPKQKVLVLNSDEGKLYWVQSGLEIRPPLVPTEDGKKAYRTVQGYRIIVNGEVIRENMFKKATSRVNVYLSNDELDKLLEHEVSDVQIELLDKDGNIVSSFGVPPNLFIVGVQHASFNDFVKKTEDGKYSNYPKVTLPIYIDGQSHTGTITTRTNRGNAAAYTYVALDTGENISLPFSELVKLLDGMDIHIDTTVYNRKTKESRKASLDIKANEINEEALVAIANLAKFATTIIIKEDNNNFKHGKKKGYKNGYNKKTTNKAKYGNYNKNKNAENKNNSTAFQVPQTEEEIEAEANAIVKKFVSQKTGYKGGYSKKNNWKKRQNKGRAR